MCTKAGSSKVKIQRLPPEGMLECSRCHELVVFRLVRTVRVSGDPGRVYAYLKCPVCGALATQMRNARRGVLA